MSRLPSLGATRSLSVALAAGFALFSLGATGCAVSADDTAHGDQAVSAEPASTCDVAATPIPDGWTVHALAKFSVAHPTVGYVSSESSDAMVQFFATAAPDSSLGAYVRTDVTRLDDAVATWTSAFEGKCAPTVEETTYLCDAARRVHCATPGGRNVEVMVVLHRGATYAASCELDGATQQGTCDAFFGTLRIE